MKKKFKAFSLLEILLSLIIFSSLILSLYSAQLQLLHQSQCLWQENQAAIQTSSTNTAHHVKSSRV